MTERAPQLLFDDGSRAIQNTAPAGPGTAAAGPSQTSRGSIPILKYYEIERIAAEVIQIVKQKQKLTIVPKEDQTVDSSWFARVALQFPDDLLSDSPDVCWEMENAINRHIQNDNKDQLEQSALVFCLGDTTFGPCCPDEVAALHLNADVLVKYGHSCLSHPALSLPVVYGFGITDHWDTKACVQSILEKAKEEGVRRLLLLYQVRYQHAMEDLQTQLSERGDIFLVAGQIQEESPERLLLQNSKVTGSDSCCKGAESCDDGAECEPKESPEVNEAQIDENALCSSTEPQEDSKTSKTFLLGGLEVPRNLDFSSFTLIFVGDDPAESQPQHGGQRQYMNTILWYLSAKSKPAGLWTYSPMTKSLQTDTPPGIQRQLNRRFFLIQKARDASIFGILIGTLSQRYFRSVVARLRDVIEKSGRSSYTFAMGKVNQAKVANFAEIECFIMVACAETSWLDEAEQRDMHVPIITPLELHMALAEGGPVAQWGACDYSLDYTDFLAKYERDKTNAEEAVIGDENADEDGDAPYFSMVTGKYESSTKANTNSVDLTALPGKGQLTTYKSEAAEFLKNREYKGLETKLGETEIAVAVPGQEGIASRYNNDIQI